MKSKHRQTESRGEAQTSRPKAEATASSENMTAQATTSEAIAMADLAPHSEERIVTSGNEQEDLNPETVVQFSLGLKNIESDGEIIVLDTLTNRCFRFNPDGTYIWHLVAQRLSVAEISQHMSEDFQITPEKALAIVTAFVAKLLRAGLGVALTETQP